METAPMPYTIHTLLHKSMLSTLLISQKPEHSARSTSLRCSFRVECWHNGGIYIWFPEIHLAAIVRRNYTRRPNTWAQPTLTSTLVNQYFFYQYQYQYQYLSPAHTHFYSCQPIPIPEPTIPIPQYYNTWAQPTIPSTLVNQYVF